MLGGLPLALGGSVWAFVKARDRAFAIAALAVTLLEALALILMTRAAPVA